MMFDKPDQKKDSILWAFYMAVACNPGEEGKKRILDYYTANEGLAMFFYLKSMGMAIWDPFLLRSVTDRLHSMVTLVFPDDGEMAELMCSAVAESFGHEKAMDDRRIVVESIRSRPNIPLAAFDQCYMADPAVPICIFWALQIAGGSSIPEEKMARLIEYHDNDVPPDHTLLDELARFLGE
jgi:hypothetical protein